MQSWNVYQTCTTVWQIYDYHTFHSCFFSIQNKKSWYTQIYDVTSSSHEIQLHPGVHQADLCSSDPQAPFWFDQDCGALWHLAKFFCSKKLYSEAKQLTDKMKARRGSSTQTRTLRSPTRLGDHHLDHHKHLRHHQNRTPPPPQLKVLTSLCKDYDFLPLTLSALKISQPD